MDRFFLIAAQVLLLVFLIGGFVVVLGQTIAIGLGNAALMDFFGTAITETACTVAGAAGISAFLLRYTRKGRETVRDEE